MTIQRTVRISAASYYDPIIKLLQELGFTEDTQKNTGVDAERYAKTLLPVYSKIILVSFNDGHYGIWVES